MATPPPLSTTSTATIVVLTVLMWIAWIALILVADFFAFMMFAFADSPGSASAAKLMIGPVFIWFGVTFIAGLLLLIFKGWWQVPLAFLLAASPPFVVFLGYNLLAGAKPVTTTSLPSPPAVPASTPQGGFRPSVTTTQPDFQAAIRNATSRPQSDPPR